MSKAPEGEDVRNALFSESMGPKFIWGRTMAHGIFGHIQLQGSVGFISRTQLALVYLFNVDCSVEVWRLLAVLRKAKRSGVNSRGTPPVIDVGEKVWNSPTIWYASGIAHEGFHIKLYQEAKMRNEGLEPGLTTYAGTEAEKKCLEFQLCVLQQLKAEDYMLEYVRELMKSPNYQGDPSSFEDYKRRDW